MTCRHGSPSDKCRICILEKELADQMEVIEALHDALEMLPIKDIEIHERTGIKINETVSRLLIESLQKENESLKAITELALNGLKKVRKIAPWEHDSYEIAHQTLREIERIQSEQT